jgi:hypothetical protein
MTYHLLSLTWAHTPAGVAGGPQNLPVSVPQSPRAVEAAERGGAIHHRSCSRSGCPVDARARRGRSSPVAVGPSGIMLNVVCCIGGIWGAIRVGERYRPYAGAPREGTATPARRYGRHTDRHARGMRALPGSRERARDRAGSPSDGPPRHVSHRCWEYRTFVHIWQGGRTASSGERDAALATRRTCASRDVKRLDRIGEDSSRRRAPWPMSA